MLEYSPLSVIAYDKHCYLLRYRSTRQSDPKNEEAFHNFDTLSINTIIIDALALERKEKVKMRRERRNGLGDGRKSERERREGGRGERERERET